MMQSFSIIAEIKAPLENRPVNTSSASLSIQSHDIRDLQQAVDILSLWSRELRCELRSMWAGVRHDRNEINDFGSIRDIVGFNSADKPEDRVVFLSEFELEVLELEEEIYKIQRAIDAIRDGPVLSIADTGSICDRIETLFPGLL